MPDNSDIALITGASSGIGAEFARQLAPRCKRMVLVGRRAEQLAAVAAELASDSLRVDCITADLATPLGVTEVLEAIRQRGPVTILVNNAGFATNGNFAELSMAEQQPMVDLHITATLALSRAAIPFMAAAGGGAIINVSSLGSLLPMAKIAVYCASKAFLNSFSEALQQEVVKQNIRVQCLLPGYTHTDFHDRESMGQFRKDKVPAEMWMDTADVVAESLAALADPGAPVQVIPGESNRALAAYSA